MKKNDDKKAKRKKEREISNRKNDNVRNFSFNTLEVVFIVFISIFFGIVVGFILTYRRNPVSGQMVSNKLQEFISIYDNIKENYYNEVSENDLLDAAISGVVGSLDDPYTLYMDDDAADVFNESVQGTYVGIGASIQTVDGKNKVAEVYEDSAADKAGLKVDDIVIKVDDKDVTNLDSTSLSKLVRGKVNTTVKITVLRNDEEKSFNIKRKTVELKYVYSKVFEKEGKKIGYLFIESFPANVYKQVNKELNLLEKKKIDSLIIDVRDNPGGYLTQVTDVLDLFFDKKTVLYQIENKNKKKKYYATDDEKRSYPVVLIGNNDSASAAEVLISCFKDNYKKATFVGETTYGKGTVQKSINLSTGASVKYTSQKWLTSKGKWIDGKGISPDVEIFLNEAYRNNPSDETDGQLQKALEILIKTDK